MELPLSCPTVKIGWIYSFAVLILLCLALYQSQTLVYNSFNPARSNANTESVIINGHSDTDYRMVAGKPPPMSPIGLQKLSDSQMKEMMLIPQCRNVSSNLREWWRTKQLRDNFTAEEDFERIYKAFRCCGMVFLDGYAETPPKDQMYPFEMEYLQRPPLRDMKDIISEQHITVQLLNNSKVYQLGDRVSALINARDFNNKPRMTGGDEIRAWLKTEINSAMANRVAAQVLDFKNGTYLVTALLPWTGSLRLYVALAYPSEHIRGILQFHRGFKGFKMIVGRFENTKASETTPCYHAPVLPGFSKNEQCNLTDVNGSPWFCGRPLKRTLSCQDYKYTRVIGAPYLKAMTATDAEYQLILRTDKIPRKRLISSSHYFNVISKSGLTSMTTSKQMCHSIDPKKTWEDRSYPTGFVFRGNWKSFLCTGFPLKGRQCMKNKHIVTLGDSNSRSHYNALQGGIGCVGVQTRTAKIWHKPLKCVSKTYNTVISWYPHTQPFLSYSDRWTSLEDLVSSVHVLDQLPWDDKQYWVILHHYIHLTPFHLSSFEAKYRAIKDAVSRLIQRLPDVRVVVQGPHISWEEWTKGHYRGGDQLGKMVEQIQREVFRDLQDKVFFVPFWDNSIARENTHYHPNNNAHMTKIIFEYLCKE